MPCGFARSTGIPWLCVEFKGILPFMQDHASIPDWLPAGKTAAVCFSIDDVHPASSRDDYETGGDLGAGALGRVENLLRQHQELQVTLFVTPNWRPKGLVRRLSPLTYIPGLREKAIWPTVHPPDKMRLDRHPEFVAYLNRMPRIEVAMHGLHHLHAGPRFAVEFQEQSRDECADMLRTGVGIFDAAGLQHSGGFQPPAWNMPDALAAALGDLQFSYVSSGRDLHTPVTSGALTDMSGLRGVSLIYPQHLPADDLLHFSANFQASSTPQRAFDIIDCGGLLSIKAHIFKSGGGHTMIDGMDDLYCNYLDLLFSTLEQRYGDSLWWTSMGEISKRLRTAC